MDGIIHSVHCGPVRAWIDCHDPNATDDHRPMCAFFVVVVRRRPCLTPRARRFLRSLFVARGRQEHLGSPFGLTIDRILYTINYQDWIGTGGRSGGGTVCGLDRGHTRRVRRPCHPPFRPYGACPARRSGQPSKPKGRHRPPSRPRHNQQALPCHCLRCRRQAPWPLPPR